MLSHEATAVFIKRPRRLSVRSELRVPENVNSGWVDQFAETHAQIIALFVKLALPQQFSLQKIGRAIIPKFPDVRPELSGCNATIFNGGAHTYPLHPFRFNAKISNPSLRLVPSSLTSFAEIPPSVLLLDFRRVSRQPFSLSPIRGNNLPNCARGNK